LPLDFLSLLEAIGIAADLLPSDHKGSYRKVAGETAAELRSVLQSSTSRLPFQVTAEERQRFKAATNNLISLTSNADMPDFPPHEALRVLVPPVLHVSRGMSKGTATLDETLALLARLNAYIADHYPS
jgi:hypothetical protein